MLLEDVAAALPAEGVYLDLHGAMVTEHYDDGEGELLRRVRALIGPDVPLVASLDLHANVTERMLAQANALIAYRTYPHIDMADTGARAFAFMQKRREGMPRPHLASRRISYLLPTCWQCTMAMPAKGLYARLVHKTLDASAIRLGQHVEGPGLSGGLPAQDIIANHYYSLPHCVTARRSPWITPNLRTTRMYSPSTGRITAGCAPCCNASWATLSTPRISPMTHSSG